MWPHPEHAAKAGLLEVPNVQDFLDDLAETLDPLCLNFSAIGLKLEKHVWS